MRYIASNMWSKKISLVSLQFCVWLNFVKLKKKTGHWKIDFYRLLIMNFNANIRTRYAHVLYIVSDTRLITSVQHFSRQVFLHERIFIKHVFLTFVISRVLLPWNICRYVPLGAIFFWKMLLKIFIPARTYVGQVFLKRTKNRAQD